MKTFKFFLAGIILIATVSCKKEIDYAAVINTLRHGSWKVTHYAEGQTVETSLFENYVFVFNQDGTATAQSGAEIILGTWVVSNGNMSTELTLHFDDVGPLTRLNRDWHVEELAGSVIVTEQLDGNADLTLARI